MLFRVVDWDLIDDIYNTPGTINTSSLFALFAFFYDNGYIQASNRQYTWGKC